MQPTKQPSVIFSFLTPSQVLKSQLQQPNSVSENSMSEEDSKESDFLATQTEEDKPQSSHQLQSSINHIKIEVGNCLTW